MNAHSGAVITRSSATRCCTHHCTNEVRYQSRVWTNERQPIPRPIWDEFCEYLGEIWPRHNGTALHISDPYILSNIRSSIIMAYQTERCPWLYLLDWGCGLSLHIDMHNVKSCLHTISLSLLGWCCFVFTYRYEEGKIHPSYTLSLYLSLSIYIYIGYFRL